MLQPVTLLGVWCLGIGLSQTDHQKLLGKWRSVETSKGGIGAIVDFRADGTFDYRPGAVIGGRYRVEDNRLVTAYDNGDPETILTIDALTNATLRLSAGKSSALDYKRVAERKTRRIY